MKLGIPYALNEIGGRTNQEDSIYPSKGSADAATRLFMVCDGMGGHDNGEVASGLVCSTFARVLGDVAPADFTIESFNEALQAAYDALDANDPDPESSRKMGTTLTFLHLNDSEVVVAHMGDSRVYHIRPSENNAILYQSSDHSLVNELVRAEVITPEEALTHPRRNVITRAMQPNLETRYKADVRTFNDVLAGDYFFLCSDGVLETITNDMLVDILRRDASDGEKIEAIRSACAASSRDNFSAYLVPIAEGLPAVHPEVVAAEVVNDGEAVDGVEEQDESATRPPVFAKGDNGNQRRTHFTPLNIALACVALIAVLAAIWFAISSIDINFSSHRYTYKGEPRAKRERIAPAFEQDTLKTTDQQNASDMSDEESTDADGATDANSATDDSATANDTKPVNKTAVNGPVLVLGTR